MTVRTVRSHQGEAALRKALVAQKPGDTLHLYGEFDGQFTNRVKDVKIVGHGAVFDAEGDEFAFRDIGGADISGATFKNAAGAGYLNIGTTGSEVVRCLAEDNEHAGFHFLKSGELRLADSEARGNGTAGASVQTPVDHHGTAKDASYDIEIVGNTFHDNGGKNPEKPTEKHQLILDGKPKGPVVHGTTTRDTYEGQTLVKDNVSTGSAKDGADFVAYYFPQADFIRNKADRIGDGYWAGFSRDIYERDNSGGPAKIVDTTWADEPNGVQHMAMHWETDL